MCLKLFRLVSSLLRGATPGVNVDPSPLMETSRSDTDIRCRGLAAFRCVDLYIV